MPRAQIKDEKTYRELRKQGESRRSRRGSRTPRRDRAGARWRPGEAVAGPIRTAQGGPSPAGARDRNQGPVEHDQGPAYFRPAEPLTADGAGRRVEMPFDAYGVKKPIDLWFNPKR